MEHSPQTLAYVDLYGAHGGLDSILQVFLGIATGDYSGWSDTEAAALAAWCWDKHPAQTDSAWRRWSRRGHTDAARLLESGRAGR